MGQPMTMDMALNPGAEGRTVTLRGASYDRDTATLDLTKVRLSLAQFVALLILIGGLIGSQAVALWRIDEMSRALVAMQSTVHALELKEAGR